MDIKLFTTGFTVAVGGIGPAIAIGMITSAALNAMGRNPEASNELRTNMILGIAFAEAVAIYALVVGLIVRFV